MMKIPDLWKFRGDYGLKDFIKKEEITTLVRLLNMKKKKKKDELRFLSFKGFNDVFIQMALLGFSKGKDDRSDQPPVNSVQGLFDLLRASIEKKINVKPSSRSQGFGKKSKSYKSVSSFNMNLFD